MEKLTWHVRFSVVRMCGITVGNSHKIFNKAVSSHVVREASFGSRCRINYGMFTRNDSRFKWCRERCVGKCVSLGKEAVLAALGWAGEVVAGV
jgi:hypothetical protein